MKNFIYENKTKIYFGKDCINNLDEEIKDYKNILLTYGTKSIKENGIYDAVKKILKDKNVYELSGILPNPRIDKVKEGKDICIKNNIDLVLAVGGGSVIDCSKVICASKFYEKDPWDLVENKSLITNALPLISILTLSATGTEANGNAVISNLDTNEKIGTYSKLFYPKVSFLDPTYTLSISKYNTFSGICDIFSHLMECYFSFDNSDVIKTYIKGLIKEVNKNANILLENLKDYEARSNIMYLSTLALNGTTLVGNNTSWSCHDIEHQLSAYYDIAHGFGLSVITPKFLKVIAKKDKNVIPLIIELLRDSFDYYHDDYLECIAFLENIFKSYGFDTDFKYLKIDDKMLNVLAKQAYDNGNFNNTVVKLNVDDIKEILKLTV